MRPLIYSARPDRQEGDQDFYQRLTPVTKFADVFLDDTYRAPPADWLIAVCQVETAVLAARQGRYREVNIASAAVIAAVVNAVPGCDIPYVFRGDGASFAFPPVHRAAIERALAGARDMARRAFRLNLRAGIVPLSDIRAAGHQFSIARYALGQVASAMFAGGGLAYAENAVRFSDTYRLPANVPGVADFSGLECRWKPVQPARGRMLALVVQAQPEHADACADLYAAIERIGGSAAAMHPLSAKRLKLTARLRQLRDEHRVRTFGESSEIKSSYAKKLLREFIAGKALFAFGLKLGAIDGKTYRTEMTRQADFQRLDSSLRLILDVTPQQEAQIAKLLAEIHRQKKIFFGIESGGAAQVTCLAFRREENHIHFVDGAQGGFAKAGLAMQEQIRASILTQFTLDREVATAST